MRHPPRSVTVNADIHVRNMNASQKNQYGAETRQAPFRLSSPFSLATSAALGVAVLAALASLGLNPGAHAQGKSKPRETAEMFQVSHVGRPGAAETRELLGTVYQDVAAKYNTDLEKAKAKADQGETYKGDRIRILRKLKEQNDDGNLYLCAYNGSPSVFAIAGEGLVGGKLSPPLANITAGGEHSTEIVRIVVDPSANKGKEPALQKVDTSTGSGVTFFGIPLDTGGSSSDSGGRKKGSRSQPGTRQVRETRTLPMFTAAISTELRVEGPPPMSQQLFVSMLKNGEVFSVEVLEQRRCQGCRGFGRVPDDVRPPGRREADGKIDCSECKAVGKIGWKVDYQIGW